MGILIGAVCVALIITILVIIMSQRVKHRKLMAQTDAAGERRLSRYPGGNVSITDEDVARMPGTAAALRSSLHASQKRSPTYLPMSSREEVDSRICANCITKQTVMARQCSTSERAPEIPLQNPLRLKRANGHPMIELHSTSLGTAQELAKHSQSAADANVNALDGESGSRAKHVTDGPAEDEIAIVRIHAMPKQNLPTLPKPLFQENRKSISHGMLSDYMELQRQKKDDTTACAPVKTDNIPRSVSLCSQDASKPPSYPVPALPPAAVVTGRQRSVQRSQNSARHSFIGANARHHCLEAEAPKIESPTLVRSSVTSLTFSHPELLHYYTSGSPERFMDDSISPLKDISPGSGMIGRVPALKPSKSSPMSLRAGQRTSDTRSEKIGAARDRTHPDNNPGVDEARQLTDPTRVKDPHISVFDFNLEVGIGESACASKRSSISALQVISGNEPRQSQKRPSSIAAKEQLKADAIHSVHERKTKRTAPKSSDRNSGLDTSSSPNLALYRAPDAEAKTTVRQPRASEISTLRQPRVDAPSFRPPSRSTFDPQLMHPLQSHRSSSGSARPHSRALAQLNDFDDFGSSPGSELSTPTKRPNRHQPSASHPNRQRPIFDSSQFANWPLVNQQSTIKSSAQVTTSHSDSNIFVLDEHMKALENQKPVPTNPSLLYRFPSPPSVISDSSNLEPMKLKLARKASVRGPRTPPHSSLANRCNRSSPVIATPTSHGKRSSMDKAASDLRKSVIALRRMNSSIPDYNSSPYKSQPNREFAGPGGHRWYLSLSDRESCFFSDAIDKDVEARMNASASVEGEGAYARRRRRRSPTQQPPVTELDEGETSITEHDKPAADGCLPAGKKIRGPRAMPSILDEDAMSGFGSGVTLRNEVTGDTSDQSRNFS